jgi:hypothetical protein
MEQGGSAPDKIKGTIHTKATAGTFGIGGETILLDACRRFHVYTMTWTPAVISIGVGGNNFFGYKNPQRAAAVGPSTLRLHVLPALVVCGKTKPATCKLAVLLRYGR